MQPLSLVVLTTSMLNAHYKKAIEFRTQYPSNYLASTGTAHWIKRKRISKNEIFSSKFNGNERLNCSHGLVFVCLLHTSITHNIKQRRVALASPHSTKTPCLQPLNKDCKISLHSVWKCAYIHSPRNLKSAAMVRFHRSMGVTSQVIIATNYNHSAMVITFFSSASY